MGEKTEYKKSRETIPLRWLAFFLLFVAFSTKIRCAKFNSVRYHQEFRYRTDPCMNQVSRSRSHERNLKKAQDRYKMAQLRNPVKGTVHRQLTGVESGTNR